MTKLRKTARELFDVVDRNARAAGSDPVPQETVDLLADAGLHGVMTPQAVGGLEASMVDAIDVFAEIARADGSAGWCLMANAATVCFFGAWAPDDFAKILFADGVPLAAGQFAPNGIATPDGDGYRITGDYHFGSGVRHSAWVGAGVMTAPAEGTDAQMLFALMPATDVQFTGNWDVLGLQSTASWDYSINDVWVPASATFDFFAPVRRRGSAMYELGVMGLTSAGHAGFALGVVRRALDELTAIRARSSGWAPRRRSATASDFSSSWPTSNRALAPPRRGYESASPWPKRPRSRPVRPTRPKCCSHGRPRFTRPKTAPMSCGARICLPVPTHCATDRCKPASATSTRARSTSSRASSQASSSDERSWRRRGEVTAPEELAYFVEPAPMTAIDEARFGWALTNLGTSPSEMADAVRGVVIHRDWAPMLGLQFADDRLADQHIRPVDQILARVLELQHEPIVTNRALPDRMVGVCRHYAVLHTALLRRQGTPARARVGFARYFGDGWVDHWITERWDGRWVRDDAQIGSVVQSALALDFDPADQPPGEFLTGAEAWLRCRAGDADPQEFGIFDLRGLWFVRGDLVLDLAALNKVELLPWDSWDPRGPEWDPSDAELEAVDDLARAVIAGDLKEIQGRYAAMPVTRHITSFVDGVPRPVDLGDLVSAS